MPSKLKHLTVTLSPELERILYADAQASDRPVATQLTWVAKQYYRFKQAEGERTRREMDILNSAQPIGPVAVDRRSETVYRGPTPEQAIEDA